MMNTPGPTEMHIRAMSAILSDPHVWHSNYGRLQSIANAATNGEASRRRVTVAIDAMRRERGLEPLERGST
jgi:hypothetical protein